MENNNNFLNVNKKSNKRLKIIGWSLFGFVLLIIVVIRFNPFSSNPVASSGISGVNISDAKSSMSINRDFEFPLKDDAGKEQGKVKFNIENAELRNEIVLKGKKASAINGKVFLIINIKITNSSDKNIGMSTKDYVRLSINGNDSELLAPEIHNDPVVIQAISTKSTRVGFPVQESDKNLKLFIGEINGSKTQIDLNLK